MRNIWCMITINLVIINFLQAQAISNPVLLEVDGPIRIGTTDNPTPDPGTIRYTGSDFEGYTMEGWVSLTGIPYIMDIDNNRYETVEIGDQVWMAENLRATRYNDGTPIQIITDDVEWSNATNIPAYTWYNNGPSDYGALYNWYVVADTNSHNICPVGWHVPTYNEWLDMRTFIGGDDKAGGLLKEAGLAHWLEPNTNGINLYGFTALPGGGRGSTGLFFEITERGYWWSATSALVITSDAYYVRIDNSSGYLYHFHEPKKFGNSVRCLKD